MAAVPGSALPQHNLYFEEAECKLYAYSWFVSLFFFLSWVYNLVTVSLKNCRCLFSRNEKDSELHCKKNRSLLDTNINDASCLSVLQKWTGDCNLLFFFLWHKTMVRPHKYWLLSTLWLELGSSVPCGANFEAKQSLSKALLLMLAGLRCSDRSCSMGHSQAKSSGAPRRDQEMEQDSST